MNQAPTNKKALIIGGGIAGPVAAMALQRAGIDSIVYEAYAHGADDVGSWLTLASNGLDALNAIDAHHLVLAEGFPTPSMVFQSGTGKYLGEVPNGGALPDGTVTQSIKRADLYRVLRDEAIRRGARVEYGKRLVSARPAADGGVVTRFADGTQDSGDLLIGADGIHSTTRRIIDPAAPKPRYVPVLNTYGYTRDVSVPIEPGQFHMVFGKRAFFDYPVNPSGEVWWFANPPRADEPSGEELAAITTEQWRKLLVDLFAKDATPATEIIRATPGRLVGWATYDIPSVPTWHKGVDDNHLGRGARHRALVRTRRVHGRRRRRRARQVPARPARHPAGVRRLRTATPRASRTDRRARGKDQQQQSRRTHRPGSAGPHTTQNPQACSQRRLLSMGSQLPHRLGREGRGCPR